VDQQGARGLVGGKRDGVGVGLAGELQDCWQGGGKPAAVADGRGCCWGLDKSVLFIRPWLNMDGSGLEPGDWWGEQHDCHRDRAWEQRVQRAGTGVWERGRRDGVGVGLWHAVQVGRWVTRQRLAWDDERAACRYAVLGGKLRRPAGVDRDWGRKRREHWGLERECERG
jgi:hypothetical protein